MPRVAARSNITGKIRRRREKTSVAVIRIAEWRPQFPPGRIESIYFHWSGGDYETVFPAYHFCVSQAGGEVFVSETNDLRANMRDVRAGGDYAAHTQGRNSFAAGIALMGMRDATPSDFGPYPVTRPLLEGLCFVAAAIASFYAIPVEAANLLTHAEAAAADGYFGDGPDERWDIARFAPDSRPLAIGEAFAAGEELRELVRRFLP